MAISAAFDTSPVEQRNPYLDNIDAHLADPSVPLHPNAAEAIKRSGVTLGVQPPPQPAASIASPGTQPVRSPWDEKTPSGQDAMLAGTGIQTPRPAPAMPLTEGGVRGNAANKFNTSLAPGEEAQYQTWKSQYAPKDSGEDYDLQGAYKYGLTPDPQTGHWSDRFKKPNEPTFSNESQYAQDAPEKAGHWEGEKYVPPAHQIAAPHPAAPAIQPVAKTPEAIAAEKRMTDLTASPSGINQIKSPWARVPLQILEAIGTGFAPGVTSAIPGTQLHHNVLVNQAENAVGQQEKIREDEEKARAEAAKEGNELAQGEHWRAQAEAALHPKTPAEKEDVHAIYAEAVRDAMGRGVNPGDDPKVQQALAAVTALNKEPAPSKPDVHVLLAEAISDAQKRGVDPAVDPHVQQVTAAIRATAAAPNDTEIIDSQIGGKPHNVMISKSSHKVLADLGEKGHTEGTGEAGTWQLEEINGKTVEYNSKTGATRPAPEGLAKYGTAAKQEAAVKPIKDAVTFARRYLDSGSFSGSEDQALIDQAKNLMTGSKRAPSATQQKTIMESRSALQGAAAIAKHYINPEAPWLDDHQRQNLVRTMEDIARAEGVTPGAAQEGGGAVQGQATHRYNPATGKIEPIK